MSNVPQVEMPRYVCHKKVWALKIRSIINSPPNSPEGSAALEMHDAGFAPVTVDVEYMTKHKPQAGGYYVVYPDGYKSFSPAKAFEEGYTLESK